MKTIRHTKYTTAILLAATTTFFSCQKEVDMVLPDDKESIGLNFYIASGVMEAAYGPDQKATAAYVDSVSEERNTIIYNTDPKYPIFAFGYIQIPQYPQVNQYSDIGLINYTRYAAGNRRVLFTDVTNTVVLDTTLSFEGKNWYNLYLTDLPGTDGSEASFTVVPVHETHEVREGLTGVRFVNLSSDAGILECRTLGEDGLPSNQILATVGFREASEYTFLNQQQAVNGILRLSVGNKQINITTGVRAMAGRSFVVVIHGVAKATTRSISTGRDVNGNILKQPITVEPGITLDVRTSY